MSFALEKVRVRSFGSGGEGEGSGSALHVVISERRREKAGPPWGLLIPYYTILYCTIPYYTIIHFRVSAELGLGCRVVGSFKVEPFVPSGRGQSSDL